MPVGNPPWVTQGSPVRAADLDAVLLAADQRFAELYRRLSWFAFDLTELPTQQVPPLGQIYVLSADAKRRMLPPPGTFDYPQYWPGQYLHDDFLDQIGAEMTFVGLDATGLSWEVSGTFTGLNGYFWGASATIVRWSFLGVSKPIRHVTDHEPERFFRYALADVFMEDDFATDAYWPGNKHGVVRLHNLGKQGVTFHLDGGTDVAVPPRSVRLLRRTSPTGPWFNDSRYYFPQCLSKDVPMWDAKVLGWANGVQASQAANPIFRQSLIQSMCRPQALTQKGPGLFSKEVIGVGVQPDSTDHIAELLCDHGVVEVVRTRTDDPAQTETFVIEYDGQLSAPSPGWAAIGLKVVLSDPDRGALVFPDPSFAPPPAGAWHFDIISRTTNLTGGIVVAAKNADVDWRVLRPWWSTVGEADEWYRDMFFWPARPTQAVEGVHAYVQASTWAPAPYGPSGSPAPNPDPDYFGTLGAGAVSEYIAYETFWGGFPAFSVVPWNLWVGTIGEALPTRAELTGAYAVRGQIYTAVCLTQQTAWWHEDPSLTGEESGAIEPWVGAPSIQYFEDGWGPIGLGTIDSQTWKEPRWKLVLLPTIGFDPKTSWHALGFKASEPIVWTPLHRAPASSGTLCHFRTTKPEGYGDGLDWYWHYGTTATHPPTHPGAPTSIVSSGMSFWRCFCMATKQPGETDPYPGQPRVGPPPWPVRDHGWLADRVLAGADSLAQPWSGARHECYDSVRIGGPTGGDVRPEEYHVGMQLRMSAAMHNQLVACVRGLTHVRPMGWEHFVDGFAPTDLISSIGWTGGVDVGHPAVHGNGTDRIIQPYGCVHVYGADATMDAALDALGITRRSSTCSELQGMATVACKEWVDAGVDGYQLGTFTRPSDWSSLGATLEWCSAQDVHAALATIGWEWDYCWLVQPIGLETVVPDASMETVVDTTANNADTAPYFHNRRRLSHTGIVCLPWISADDPAPYQLAAGSPFKRVSIAHPRKIQSQVLGRRSAASSPWPAAFRMDIVRIDLPGDVADALNRAGAWAAFSVTYGSGAGTGAHIWWSVNVLAGGGLGESWTLAAVPKRQLLWDFAPDEVGPRVFCDTTVLGVACVRPTDRAKIRLLTVHPGDRVTLGLVDGVAPVWPDDHYTWDLGIMPKRGLRALEIA